MKFKVVFALFAFLLFIQAAPISVGDGIVNLNQLFDYESDLAPSYVEEDWTPPDNLKSNIEVTLGRVLFYDKKLSLNESVSCSSCHNQAFAFGDPSVASEGFDGQFTKRHAPRLVNISHRLIPDVFWDGSEETLENQPARALSNSIEMGFSGTNGQPDLDSLISRLNEVDYYEVLSEEAFGDETLTIERVEKSLAQFVRSIVSYDSKLDEALALGFELGDSSPDFPNYSNLENYGKSLFFSPNLQFQPPNAVVPDSLQFFNCDACHAGPNISNTFAFGAANNGVIGVAGDPFGTDLNGTNPPSLRNLFTPDGNEIGPFMHDGSLPDLTAVLEHYSFIPHNPNNGNFTVGFPVPPSGDVNLPMTNYQVEALIAFLKTLSGTDVFTNPKWSNPFNDLDELVVIPPNTGEPNMFFAKASLSETMNTNLSNNGILPLTQPYSLPPYNYAGNEAVPAIPSNVVDWVLIELRDPSNVNSVVHRQAAFLKTDGTLLDLNGQNGITLTASLAGQYFVSINHRGHLGVVTRIPISLASTVDFTNPANIMGTNQLSVSNGIGSLKAGDSDGNGTINFLDFLDWFSVNNELNSYANADFNLDGTVNFLDFLKWFENNNTLAAPAMQY